MSAERVARLKESLDDPNLVSFEPWVVRELLDHIDGLKFANGVLDSAAKDAQTWSYEAQTAKEAYCELLEANRVTEEAGGVIAQLNGMIDELRAQLEAQRGGAVVVPELTDRDLYDAWLKCDYGLEEEPIYHEGVRDGYKLAVSRIQPIPASQVLQPGMVGVDRNGLQDVYEALAYSQPTEPSVDPHSNTMAHRRALGFCADALRSQAGEVSNAG